jgi:hypothetical protein
MALAGALCAIVHTITGFTNRSLRAQVSVLLGEPYSMSQMSYDLRRLRNNPRVPGAFCGLYNPRTWAFAVYLCWFWHLKLSRVF